VSIIAIDPGATCGVFEFNLETCNGYHDELTPYELAKTLDTEVDPDTVDAIVIERYTQQSTKLTPQHDALMVIGVVTYLAKKYDWRIITQSRADKSRVDNETLMHIGWYASRATHSNDAARHALIGLSKIRPQHPIMQLVAGRI
jgi:hypothetical protein